MHKHTALSTWVRGVLPATVLAASLAAPAVASSFLAYSDPAAQGNQNFGGNLALTFDVLTPITVTALGVFNAAGNGIIIGPIQVVIYDTNLHTQVTPVVTFAGSYTTQGSGFDVFQSIAPVVLGPGSYLVDAIGFSGNDLNGNRIFGTSGPVLNDGGGQIAFTGAAYDSSGSLDEPSSCAGCIAGSGQTSQFNAGTFAFDAASATPTPEPATSGLLGCAFAGMVAILRCRRAR
jgi:hypothetical protein